MVNFIISKDRNTFIPFCIIAVAIYNVIEEELQNFLVRKTLGQYLKFDVIIYLGTIELRNYIMKEQPIVLAGPSSVFCVTVFSCI